MSEIDKRDMLAALTDAVISTHRLRDSARAIAAGATLMIMECDETERAILRVLQIVGRADANGT